MRTTAGTTARHHMAAFLATALLLVSLAFAAGRALGPESSTDVGSSPSVGVVVTTES